MVTDTFRSARDLADAIRAREVSASEALEHHLARIAQLNPELNAIVTLDTEGARERARAADQALARGESWGPLHGVPFTLKDAHATAGMRTTFGHPPFRDQVPIEDGTVAARLKAAGGILLGKTNVPALLMSAQTDNPIFGRTNNPWDRTRTAGGSSGGSAAAVAAGLVPFDVGSDITGSIRMPAHYCGVFGLKPTANRLPTTGHMTLPNAPRPDRLLGVVGPIARSIADLELVARLLAGPDGRDIEVPPVPWRDATRREPRSLRIAFMPVFPGVHTARAVRSTVERVAEELAREGARVEERTPGFTIETLTEVWSDFFRLAAVTMSEIASMSMPLEPPEGAPPTLGQWVRVLHRRDALVAAIDALLTDFDAFLCPTCIGTAFPHGPPRTPIPVDGELVESRFVNHYVYPFNFTGNPAVAVPAGLADDGLPVGVQVVGRRWTDEHLLAVAAAVAEVAGGFRPPPRA